MSNHAIFRKVIFELQGQFSKLIATKFQLRNWLLSLIPNVNTFFHQYRRTGKVSHRGDALLKIYKFLVALHIYLILIYFYEITYCQMHKIMDFKSLHRKEIDLFQIEIKMVDGSSLLSTMTTRWANKSTDIFWDW